MVKHVPTRRMITATQAVRSFAGCAAQLARFFPETQPVQVRAVLTTAKNGANKVHESVLVEFASGDNALFTSTLPLEFGEHLTLKHLQEKNFTEAIVVAVQHQQECRAIAVRFSAGPCSWVKRP